MSLKEELHEAKVELLDLLGLDSTRTTDSLDAMAEGEIKYIRDTKVNLKNTLGSPHLTDKEAALLALAVAVNERNVALKEAFTRRARDLDATDAEIGEIHALTSLLGINNVFYRFRHFSDNKNYEQMPARIKMTLMARPVLGKEFFELASLAVSAVNGCEACVNSHEQSVRQAGATEERIFDAIRLASVVKGVSAIIN